MEVSIYSDYAKLSAETADRMIKLLMTNPGAVFCLASGNTPVMAYKLFTEEINQRNIDCSKCTIVGLDEWLGIDRQNQGTCFSFFKKHILDKLSLDENQYHFFNSDENIAKEECKRMDAFIHSKNGIDLMIVGIGMNGHVGFNEPGTSFDLYSHIIDLDTTTRTVGQKYFTQRADLEKGITLGLKHLMEAKEALMLANGDHKAKIIQATLQYPTNNAVPASIIKQHANSALMLDRDAASLL